MIWLKENDNMVGYVPVLNKSYTEKEIRHMSEFSCYEGWSDLSCFVMTLQGLGYEYDNGMDSRYSSAGVPKLINVGCSFDFEYFCLKTDERMKIYLKQIYEVFSNLTLYKVEQRSITDITKCIYDIKETLSHNFISKRTLSNIDDDFKTQIKYMEETTKNLKKLLKEFSDFDFPHIVNLYKVADKDASEKFSDERKIEKILVY